MSMLSAQVDKLRELATRYDELQVGAVKAVTMPSDMGSILREAADTIWELRNKRADLMDERERLFRANVEKNGEILRLVGENAKLRKLVRFIMHQCNDGNPRCDECIGRNDGECVALLRMRELGVEATE